MSTDEEEEYRDEREEEYRDEQEEEYRDEREDEYLWDDERREDDLYDLFQLHTSNQAQFMSLDQGNPHFLECPVCGELLHTSQVSHHIMYQHSSFFLSMNVFMNPRITLEDLQSIVQQTNTLQTVQRLMMDEEPSYEDLLSLCDQIGYCKPGIQDPDEVAPIVEKEVLVEEQRCCICLEDLREAESIRKIKQCQHLFCSACIVKWFEENRTCPLCNLHVCNSLARIGSVGGLEDVD